MNPISRDNLAAQIAIDTITDLNQRGVLNGVLDAAGIPSSPPEQLWKTNRVAILFWRAYVKAGGLGLDPELWRLEAGAEACIADAIEKALEKGQDASKATAAFLYTSGLSSDMMRVGINHPIDEYTDFGEHITSLFSDWINLSFVSVQNTILRVG